jgi:D-lactate dehydrogenase
MDDLVELIVGRLDGALKAEHGTGRNIAPFVETEWGPEAYAVMRRLKEILDPEGVLNPGVVLNDDPQCHLQHLKHLPSAAPEVDACVECGFCERVCPSVDLTLSPRRRIAVLRHLERLRQVRPDANGDGPAIDRTIGSLLNDYRYAGLDTCAADGLCSTACPVGIDTGRLVKRLRDEHHGAGAHRIARWVADHAGTTEALLRFALNTAHGLERVLGAGAVRGSVSLARKLTGMPLPAWVDSQPRPPRNLDFMTAAPPPTVDAIVFPTCVSRIMGRPRGRERSQTEVLLELCRRAGVAAWAPAALGGCCCGLAMASKGHADASRRLLTDLVARLHDLSGGGRIPVVIDASSCTHAALEGGAKLAGTDRERWEALDLVDVTSFARDTLLARLELSPLDGKTFVHPNCALRLMGGDPALLACVEAASGQTVVPDNLACCATAGDRGLIFPELSASALRHEKDDLAAADPHRAVSSNLSCETGLGAQTGMPFESFLYLLEEASRGGGSGAAPRS